MIRVGTCSWTERSLIQSGEFYPRAVRTAEGRLRYYADNFDTVEVDSTYYAIPDSNTTLLWDKRTPENFIFHIKAYGALTGHGVDRSTLPRDIAEELTDNNGDSRYIFIKDLSVLSVVAERFKEALAPLVNSGKLGLLVFQYPPWFQHGKKNFDYILRCRELMKELPVAVEFRHGSWLSPGTADSVFAFLRDHGLTYVAADEPQYGNQSTVPFIATAAGDTAYFRFHGRNRETWLKKGVETSLRYNYLYSDEELKELASAVLSVSRGAAVTYAMFNNCHGGFAMRNALRLKELTGLRN
ncbi:MAG TPA: DUF72 domain-containing protein [Thermodesulfovibrionales bacterium]|nr:DUF72 domain-containing protein [Thermodesulfovibrionales bacterium]